MNEKEKIEKKQKIAKELINILFTGAELGIGNSCLRGITQNQYYLMNKNEWDTRAEAIIKYIQGGHG